MTQRKAENNPRDGAATILIVDDNRHVTAALSTLVRNAGFNPIGCHCGQDALDRAAEKPCAAAVVDIHLPDINGLVLAQKLREQFGPDKPIVVVSGDTSIETLKSLSHVGATYFFSKPLNSAMMIERLRELIGKTGD